MTKLMALVISLLIFVSCNKNAKKPNLTADNQNTSKLNASIKRGEVVYNDMCISCHLSDGKGLSKVFPPLADSDFLRENQTKSIKGVKNGMTVKITVNGITYNSIMAPLGLSNEEVADVMNYINNSWGNKIKGFVTSDKVSKL